MKPKLKRHYSGNHSKRFWDRVNKIPRNEHGETAYMLGVVLQEVELRVLRYLEQVEAGDLKYERWLHEARAKTN